MSKSNEDRKTVTQSTGVRAAKRVTSVTQGTSSIVCSRPIQQSMRPLNEVLWYTWTIMHVAYITLVTFVTLGRVAAKQRIFRSLARRSSEYGKMIYRRMVGNLVEKSQKFVNRNITSNKNWKSFQSFKRSTITLSCGYMLRCEAADRAAQ